MCSVNNKQKKTQKQRKRKKKRTDNAKLQHYLSPAEYGQNVSDN